MSYKDKGKLKNKDIPALIAVLKTPHHVANALGVYPNAVRQWLLKHDYKCVNGEWKKVESVHVA